MTPAHTAEPWAVTWGCSAIDYWLDRAVERADEDLDTERMQAAKVELTGRVARCVNALHGLTPAQVERIGRWFAQYNGDEVEQMLTESGV